MDTRTTPATAETNREHLATSLRELVAESEELVKHIQRSGGEQLQVARDRFETTLASAREELESMQDNAMRRARRAAKVADETVHQHPYASMGAAAAVGALIGMLITRR
jgi:ElaB/YqjD/DUF883 family membrane-anchored ribosome-binding protein